MKTKILLKCLPLAVLFSSLGFAQYTGGSGSGYAMGISEKNFPLPVELVNFNAKVVKDNVVLNWTTETEVSNYGFNVERSGSNKMWQKIGFVEGSGNSNSIKDYSFTDSRLTSGLEYYYRLKQIDTDGQYEYSNEVSVSISIDAYNLYQNYPNPFNPTTTINFSLPEEALVKLKIWDILGSEIAVLVNERLGPGNYETIFNISSAKDGIPSGVYFYTLEAGSFIKTNKMIIMK
ncbi:MAG: T9SS type A sorting domain-containing protein [Ignavibacteria bacterium]|nr:T9SS type A sorting domain-containing protein [Ignavibacteria bacterium]MBT8392896.1 T9SS type A sorting domain-containing protein [Ignavibacteria bacterium]NNL20834.1 T9SS type A sorting domain-containing protein [Ignavibacteriaceae bacterium]